MNAKRHLKCNMMILHKNRNNAYLSSFHHKQGDIGEDDTNSVGDQDREKVAIEVDSLLLHIVETEKERDQKARKGLIE